MTDATDHPAWKNSRAGIYGRMVTAALQRSTAQSWILAILTVWMGRLKRGRQTSSIISLYCLCSEFTRQSFLYRWLTSEPEPDVIVIDLRDTYTVGTILSVHDCLVGPLVPWYHTSLLNAAIDVLGRFIDRFAETKIGRMLIAVLEPPEPP